MRTAEDKARIVIDVLNGQSFTEMAEKEGVTTPSIGRIFYDTLEKAAREGDPSMMYLRRARANKELAESRVREWASMQANGQALSTRAARLLERACGPTSKEQARYAIECGHIHAGSPSGLGRKMLREIAQWAGAEIPSERVVPPRAASKHMVQSAISILERHGYTVLPPREVRGMYMKLQDERRVAMTEIAIRYVLEGDDPSKIAEVYGIKKQRVAERVRSVLRAAAMNTQCSVVQGMEYEEIEPMFRPVNEAIKHKDFWAPLLREYLERLQSR